MGISWGYLYIYYNNDNIIMIIIMIIITMCKLALLPDNPLFTPAFDVISVFFP